MHDPICPPCVELMGAEASAQYDAEASAAAERGDVFETLYTSPPKEETRGPRADETQLRGI
jgi:hypothetical protein